MFIYIGCDHAGFELKNLIISSDILGRFGIIIDCGCMNQNSVDYPDIAKNVSHRIKDDITSGIESFGILICGTGIGMSIASNKIESIRSALIYDKKSAEFAKKHNNANIICLGSRFLDSNYALELIQIFLSSKFEGGRHERRINKLI